LSFISALSAFLSLAARSASASSMPSVLCVIDGRNVYHAASGVIVMTPLLTADSTAFSDMLGLLECN
jgi:hypothetical protein